MALDPDLSNVVSLRGVAPDRVVEITDPAPGEAVAPQDGKILRASDGTEIQIADDGSVTFVDADPQAATQAAGALDPADFAANLAAGANVSTLVEDLIQGIDTDIASRSELEANYIKGIDLLGLKIEDPSQTRTQKRNISKVGHPMLLEATVKYQSQARGEMLPAAGPAKVQIIGDSTDELDDLAKAFEDDFNYFLTDIATEFYPDTDRMLFYQGFGGVAYKKVYRCPVRRRPVSESVYLTDLIVSESATDLDNAIRVTHQIKMDRNTLKRMQYFGRYLNVDLGYPSGMLDPARRKIQEAQGLAPMAMRPQDQPYTVYEVDVTLIPAEFGFYDPLAPVGLPVPYKVTIERDSRACLAIWRNWKQGDDSYRKRNMYVKYGLVPGLGFHDYGFLQLLGNQTRALRAIWRLLIDAGMFSNFPGGMKVKGARTQTNEIAPGPGEWIDVDVPIDQDLTKSLVPMPYKGPDGVFIQFAEAIEQDCKGLSAAVEIEAGEGRANVPVGTIMAMIEQQTQVMAAVHKRNHTSQKTELGLIRDLFIENPEDLWRLARNPARRWQVAAEFENLNLVPVSDPNVPSQTHRIMQATGLVTLLNSTPPGMLDPWKVISHALRTIGISDPDSLRGEPPAPQQAPPDPRMITAQATAQEKMARVALDHQESQRKAAEAVSGADSKQRELEMQTQAQQAETQSREQIAAMREQTERTIAAGRLALEQAKIAQGGGFGGTGFGAPSVAPMPEGSVVG